MSMIWTEDGPFRKVEYSSEKDLEEAILRVKSELFGNGRIYLDVKKKIGRRGGQRNVPDGYLLDLSGRQPRLYVVENELAAHDPLRHIAVQILQFSLSFKSEPRTVREIVFDAIQADIEAQKLCSQYVLDRNYRNLDHLIDVMVFESPFSALVIIDEIPENLEKILAEEFRFGVEVLYLARYQNKQGHRFYHFDPFLADLNASSDNNQDTIKPLDATEINTVVVPAHREGFENTFLKENRWYAIRMHGTIRPQIEYIAVYQVRPISAITHVGRVKSIEPWGDSGKYVVNLDGLAQQVKPLKLVKNGKVKTFQNLRYTSYDKLMSAGNLDDVFSD